MKTRILGVAALLAVVAATLYGLFGVPADLNQGDAQRIMYPHVSSAWLAYLSFGVTALAGLGWLVRRDLRFDAVAVASAEIGVLFTALAIWGGMMWGRPVWGVFWQWDGLSPAPASLGRPGATRDAGGGGGSRRRDRHPHRPFQRDLVAEPPSAADLPVARQDPESIGASPVRACPGRDARRLHAGVDMADDPALPTGARRARPRGVHEKRRDSNGARRGHDRGHKRGRAHARAAQRTGGGGSMSDVGYVVAGYGVIIGSLAVYAALLLRRLARSRQHRSPGDDGA